MQPVRLPQLPETGAEAGALWAIARLGLYALLVVGMVAYLLWKLPRGGDADGL